MRVLPNIFNGAFGLLLLAAAIGTPLAADTTPDPVQTTEPECVRRTDPIIPAAEGRRAYMRLNCYSCHGNSAHGGAMGPSLVGKANEADVVYEGDGHGMPGFQDNLCPNDVAYLAAYLDSLGTDSEPKFTHWWERGPDLPSR